MRWLVEVSSVGKTDLQQKVCVEAESWQRALQAARAQRGEEGPMSGFSIELLEEGYRAVDPVARTRFVVKRATDDTPLTVAPAAKDAPKPPVSSMPMSVKAPKAPVSSSPLGMESGPTSQGPKSVPPRPGGPASVPPKKISIPAPAPSSGLAVGSTTPGLPRVSLLTSREQNPTETSPLTYREYAFAVPAGTSEEVALAVLRAQLKLVDAQLEGGGGAGVNAKMGKLVNLAVFDVEFTGKPPAPPLVTLTWKDWKGEPVVAYPRRTGAPATSRAPGPSRTPSAPPVARPPSSAAPAAAAPSVVVPPAPLVPSISVVAPVQVVHPVGAGPGPASTRVPASVRPPPPNPFATAPSAAPPPMPQAAAPASAPSASAPPPPPSASVPPPVVAPVATFTPSAPPVMVATPSASPPPAPPGFPVGTDIPEPVIASLPAPPMTDTPAGNLVRTPSGRFVRGRTVGDELISALFESMHDLHFLRDALDGGQFCLALATEVLPARAALIHFFDIEKREWVVACTRGKDTGKLLTSRAGEMDELLREAARKRRALVVEDASMAAAARYGALGGTKSLIIAPFMQAGRALGALEIINPLDGKPFDEDEGNAMTYIAEQFAEYLGSRGIVLDKARIQAAAR